MKNFRVCLVAMPFVGVESPSQALGVLKRYFQQSGTEVDILYLNLKLAAKLGLENYFQFTEISAAPGGNMCFARAAYGPDAVPRLEEGTIHQQFQEACDAFIEDCVWAYDWKAYDLVGFTTAMSVSITSSIALAKRLKSEFGTLNAIGGIGMFYGAGEEYAKIPWLDYVVTGHVNQNVIDEFVGALQGTGSFSSIPGLLYKEDGVLKQGPEVPIQNMDLVPVPDYSDYVQQLQDMPFKQEPAFTNSLLYNWYYAEMGRGCFYGDVQTCTFCSDIDLGHSVYRSFDAGVRYLKELTSTYPEHEKFFLTDPLIDRCTQREILPELNKTRARHQRFFAEVKPWMNRDEIRELFECGVFAVQAGIESLHPKILKLLRKGQKSHTCIAALKWFGTFNVTVYWNFLIQIPGEDQDSYFEMAQLIPKLRHLPKPAGPYYPLYITRGSPYWKERETWKFENLRPHRSYQYIIPSFLDKEVLSYAWEYDIKGRSCFEIWQSGHLALLSEIMSWLTGEYHLQLEGDTIKDSRDGQYKTITLSDEERALLVFCDTPRNADQLTTFSPRALSTMLDKDLIIHCEHKYLGLSIIPDREM